MLVSHICLKAAVSGEMTASRSTIIKAYLAHEGPQTIRRLYEGVINRFPEQFAGVSRHKFKTIYLKNMRDFKQITMKLHRGEAPEGMSEKEFTKRAIAEKKGEWLVILDSKVAEMQLSGKVDLDVNHQSILDHIRNESAISKDFWEGRSNQPYDWRAVLEAAGRKTSL
ncbi:hypothetical protein LPJ61_000041 [Coemansia biformis]|uniref:Uncharacterized protein n=1 Tax=Coemansia biformis TaxID=1286918 RepID=A0A9W7YHE2_9FUNG|nr:hypothetical protein LPJ61_000041 [Coemansia biformis]